MEYSNIRDVIEPEPPALISAFSPPPSPAPEEHEIPCLSLAPHNLCYAVHVLRHDEKEPPLDAFMTSVLKLDLAAAKKAVRLDKRTRIRLEPAFRGDANEGKVAECLALAKKNKNGLASAKMRLYGALPRIYNPALASLEFLNSVEGQDKEAKALFLLGGAMAASAASAAGGVCSLSFERRQMDVRALGSGSEGGFCWIGEPELYAALSRFRAGDFTAGYRALVASCFAGNRCAYEIYLGLDRGCAEVFGVIGFARG